MLKNNLTKMIKEEANKIYDILVNIGGASESERDKFVYDHCESKNIATEWRFCGKFGFGGKYRSKINKVTYYPEDETFERIDLLSKINIELSKIN